MAKKQTRRSISLKGLTYQRLKEYCDANKKSVSGYLEVIIAEKLDEAGAPVPTVLGPRPSEVSKPAEPAEAPKTPEPVKVAAPPKPRSGPTDFSQELEESFGKLKGPNETTNLVLGESRKTGDHDPWE